MQIFILLLFWPNVCGLIEITSFGVSINQRFVSMIGLLIAVVIKGIGLHFDCFHRSSSGIYKRRSLNFTLKAALKSSGEP